MGSKTKIEWWDSTWNPIVRCSSGRAYFISSRKLEQPLHWRKPRRIFVCSIIDLFHSSILNEQIASVFAVCALCQQHTFLILTKRPDRVIKWCKWSVNYFDGMNTIAKSGVISEYIEKIITERWLKANVGVHYRNPFPDNVWIGVSVEDQETADYRIPKLLEIPAKKRFVSVEPMLSQIDIKCRLACCCDEFWPGQGHPDECPAKGGIDWIICGSETGPGKRPMNLDWARTLRDQCIEANVPFFFKKDSLGRHGIDGQIWEQFPK
jgi:protein gp37